jgi:hypothetical protein
MLPAVGEFFPFGGSEMMAVVLVATLNARIKESTLLENWPLLAVIVLPRMLKR